MGRQWPDQVVCVRAKAHEMLIWSCVFVFPLTSSSVGLIFAVATPASGLAPQPVKSIFDLPTD